MSIIYLQNKHKSKYSLNLIPNRTWSSGSNGIEGSVYVFPNRSEIQKDNIDERLELAGTYGTNGSDEIEVIVPYSNNSLEQFRIDIFENSFYNYRMEFSKFETLMYMRSFLVNHGQAELSGKFYTTIGFGTANTVPQSQKLTKDQINSILQTINENQAKFWDWMTDNNIPRIEINTVDDKNLFPQRHFYIAAYDDAVYEDGINIINLPDNPPLELQLALLLDGAHPAAIDHIFRPWIPGGNDPSDPLNSRFSGNEIIYTDQFKQGYLLGNLINDETQLELWPPEIDKYYPDRKKFELDYTTIGYSDVSMHPRNRTKKDITILRCNQSILSKGNAAQKIIYNNLSTQVTKDFGWWVDNKFSLNLSSWQDNQNNTFNPVISYGLSQNSNVSAKFFAKQSNDEFMFEFWIKPSELQLKTGSIFYLKDNYNVLINPSVLEDNKALQFKIEFNWDGNSFEADTSIDSETWNHICIRYSPNYNNGQLNIIINGNSNVDDGTIVTGNIGTVGKRLWIGGIPADNLNEFSDMGAQGFANYGFNVASNEVFIDNILVSEIHELRIWNVANDVQTISDLKNSTLDNVEDLCFYVPMVFESTINDQDWKKNNWNGDFEAETIEQFYENATVTYGSTKQKEFPLDCNNAYITGVPFMNVHQFLRNKAVDETDELSMPFISGFPTFDINIGDSRDFIPTEYNMNSWMETWPQLDFLKCINSMILPCDNDNYKNNIDPFINMFLNKDSDNLEGVFNDEIITIIEQNINDVNEEQQKTFMNNWRAQTDEWTNQSTFLDFLNPTSVIINIPQIFYANHITPETVVINATIDSKGKVITLKDKDGIIYRYADNMLVCKVGHIDYYNGQIIIFHPSLTNISLYDWNITFKGNKNLHVMQFDIPCESYKHNISFNESHNPKSLPSSNANETDNGYKMISNINLHDDNMNVIAKVNLAQPIVKRNEDSFVFRVKLDF